MNYDTWKSTEPVAYEEPRPICQECGGDVEDDGHAVTCSFHVDYYEPPIPEYDDDEVTR